MPEVQMTEAERDLWLAFKAVLRESTGLSPAKTLSPADKVEIQRQGVVLAGILGPHECGVRGRGDTVCRKPSGHGQRHRYTGPPASPPRIPPTRDWSKIDSVGLKSGSRTYVLKVGNPCKVIGQRGLFKVIGIEQHVADERVNVEVTNDRTGHSRVFPVAKIQYKRPKKVAA